MKKAILVLAIALVGPQADTTLHAQSPSKQAVVETSAGTFVIDLLPDAAPNQTAYFTKLAGEGVYTGTIFHRVIKYGMVQGGDPLTKDPAKRTQYGTGGLNAVKAETRAPKMTRGSVAAVTIPGKPDSAGAQFFAVLPIDRRWTTNTPSSVACQTGWKCYRRFPRRRLTTKGSPPSASRSRVCRGWCVGR
jgi:cyclophilin family peptidyl-prolyl cis-trans isomerase